MRRVLSYMVARNEAHRYLEACLYWNMAFLDGLAFFDDSSDDETRDVASMFVGVKVCSRSDDTPSFLEHEGRFRAAAWEWFEDIMNPQEGDWVLALDADEFLGADGGIRDTLAEVVDIAERHNAVSVRIPVPEVFAVEEDDGYLIYPKVRVDGYWGTIAGTRLFRWQPGGVFQNKSMGCGAEPTYVARSRISEENRGLHLLHYGYAHPEDREEKYERYTSLLDHGHSNSHVQSIVKDPTLQPWMGSVPVVWRGSQQMERFS